ncbi:MAG TPA: MBL fold metallo-hydrolase [Burkholderiales bacterium]|nr:MBL fold metallo-hydrolase [Burkholderiales bacterium]
MNHAVLLKAAAEPAPLRFPYQHPPAPGTVIEVAPGIFWLRMPLPFALDHINLWALRDRGGFTLVDCGLSTETTRALWDQQFAGQLRSGEVKRVLVTHFHPDHMGLAGWLTRRLDVSLWMTEAEYLMAHVAYAELPGHRKEEEVQLWLQHGIEPARGESIRRAKHSYRRAISEPPASFRRIMDGEHIDIDGDSWQIMVGYGHAPEHAALYCAERGVLISGDMVLPKISTNVSVWPEQPEADPLSLFLRSLARYAQLPPDTLILPSHGLPFYGLQSRAEALRAHHDARLAEVLSACERPASAAEIVPVLFRRTLDDHQWRFAMGEAIAHLNYLQRQGKLVREEHADVVRFARPAHIEA